MAILPYRAFCMIPRSPPSAHPFLDRLDARGGQRDRAAADVVVLGRVQTQRRVDGREQAAGVNLLGHHRVALRVGLPVHRAALDAGPGDGATPGAGEVVAAEAGVDTRRAAELR